MHVSLPSLLLLLAFPRVYARGVNHSSLPWNSKYATVSRKSITNRLESYGVEFGLSRSSRGHWTRERSAMRWQCEREIVVWQFSPGREGGKGGRERLPFLSGLIYDGEGHGHGILCSHETQRVYFNIRTFPAMESFEERVLVKVTQDGGTSEDRHLLLIWNSWVWWKFLGIVCVGVDGIVEKNSLEIGLHRGGRRREVKNFGANDGETSSINRRG